MKGPGNVLPWLSGAWFWLSDVKRRQSEEKQSKGKVRVRNVSALHSSVTSGGATALSSKAMEWQSIGMDMYSLGIARH